MLAQELSGKHVGLVVEFNTKVEYSEVELQVRGELRSVTHDGTGEVEVLLTSPSRATGSLTSYGLTMETLVTIYDEDGVVL